MALIQCPECNKEISDKVKDCPFCGFPFEPIVDLKNDVQQVEIASVNIAPKDPSKIKKITTGVIAIVVTLAIVFAILIAVKNNNEKKEYNVYIDNLNLVREKMIDSGSKAESLLNLTARVWYNTIFEERDSETDKYTMSGKDFNEDFNISLSALFYASSTQSTISTIEEDQDLVESTMKVLQNPPEGLENCYDTVTELYSVYKGLTDLAINPSGSLQSFSDNKSQKIDKFLELFNRLNTQIPQKK
ncbi:MAG: hypothetical protein CL609_03530 [Anaerolineaceae bacterium]|nr:hypothetical protein [Anaerolineaceae bacterium]